MSSFQKPDLWVSAHPEIQVPLTESTAPFLVNLVVFFLSEFSKNILVVSNFNVS